jgi:hypothetical protein
MITVAGAGVSQLRRLMFISPAALLALLYGLSASAAQAMKPDLQRVLGAG